MSWACDEKTGNSEIIFVVVARLIVADNDYHSGQFSQRIWDGRKQYFPVIGGYKKHLPFGRVSRLGKPIHGEWSP